MLKQEIEQQIKDALKSGDQVRLSTLRFLLAAIQNEEIAKKRELSDEEIVTVVQRQIKQHRESIEAFSKGGRSDLASKEEDELTILSTFVPQQLSPEELRKIVQEVVATFTESDKKNFGKVMGAVMGKVKGRAEGNIVSEIVKEIIK
ncbi:MAG: GatB/YqeY domain-containing protein [Microgenomates group bacterium]